MSLTQFDLLGRCLNPSAPGALAFRRIKSRRCRMASLASLLMAGALCVRAQPAPTAENTRLITLDDVVRMVLTNNLDIAITKYNPILDQYATQGLFGSYDPVLGFQASSTYNAQPGQFYLGTNFPSYKTSVNSYAPDLRGELPFGMTYDLTTPLQEQTYPFRQYSAEPSMTLTQPLLKNGWIDNSRYQIQLSRKTWESDLQSVRLQMENSVNGIKTAYYNLIAARENVEVQRAAVALAQQLMDENTRKVQLGAMAPLDQRQAESQAASSQSDLLAAQLAQAIQENTLKSLLSLNLGEWRGVTPVPTETLAAQEERPEFTESVSRALESRPEMVQAKISVEKQHLTIKYDYNQLYPELDLKATWGLNSVGPAWGPTLETLREGKDQAYSIGASITFPLGNTSARNTYKSAKASLEQTLLQMKKTETGIVIAVDNDVKTVRSDWLRVDSTRKAREYAEDALKAGQTRLVAGSTTSFEILQLQSNLTTARSAEIRALADYNIALEQLALDEGVTLERSKIDLKTR